MKRYDRHAPSSKFFDPAAYRFMGVYDNHSQYGDTKGRMRVVNSLVEEGYKFGHGSSNQCGHCGARIRYAALMVRDDIKEFIFVGEDCLDNRFSGITKDEFQRLRKAAALNRDRVRRADKLAAFLLENPWLSELSNETSSYFLSDMFYALHRNGELTPRQLEATKKALERERNLQEIKAKREEEKKALIEEGVKAPTGKQPIVGTISNVKLVDGMYGSAWKMRVVTDERWSVWVTIPATIIDDVVDFETSKIKSQTLRVRLVATLQPSKDDPTFAFGSRPSRASLI